MVCLLRLERQALHDIAGSPLHDGGFAEQFLKNAAKIGAFYAFRDRASPALIGFESVAASDLATGNGCAVEPRFVWQCMTQVPHCCFLSAPSIFGLPHFLSAPWRGLHLWFFQLKPVTRLQDAARLERVCQLAGGWRA